MLKVLAKMVDIHKIIGNFNRSMKSKKQTNKKKPRIKQK